MTRVDFYVLQDKGLEARLNFCCRLIEKAVRRGNNILVWVPSLSILEQLDEALWTFKPESFIPHKTVSSGPFHPEPKPHSDAQPHTAVISPQVIISFRQDITAHHDVLINLDNDIPPVFSRFERMAEVVVQDKPILEETRQHYRFLQERGYPINMHKL